ncbi:MAG: helix-turn-helix domain-containing protein [Anaerolineae bacterium]|nr:helix-turn-helix domain-containing protein [Anaerolineae bacterium]
MKGTEVLSLWKQGRGPQVEFVAERTTSRALAKILAGMANAEGGTVLLGVPLKTHAIAGVAGLRDPETALDMALQAALICEPPLIIPLPRIVALDDAQIVIITVPRGLPHVYAVEGRYMERVGSRNEKLSPLKLRRLLIGRGDVSFESLPAKSASFQDLDWDRAQRYAETTGLLPGISVEELLRKRGCIIGDDGVPTNAGILLFGRETERLIRTAEIIVARYAGRTMSDSFIREDIRGPLPDQIRQAEAFIMTNMRRGANLSALEREEHPEYPPKAVREAIVNAVAHRDYSTQGDTIRIFMFSDRMEFYSPGKLPGHVTVTNIVDERFSRNEAIVQVLADMGFIERLGYGIDRMIQLMRQDGLPAPQFKEKANGFLVTLYGHGDQFLATPDVPGGWAHMGLNDRQKMVLVYLTEHQRITNRECQELCPDVSAETIRRDLADLVHKGVLLRIGQKRATYYILK